MTASQLPEPLTQQAEVQPTGPAAHDEGGAHAPDADAHGQEAGGSSRRRSARHSVTARTKARRRAVEILFEADQRGMLATYRRGSPGAAGGARAQEAAERLRELAAERAVRSANHTQAPAYTRQVLDGVCDHLADIDGTIETYAQGWALSRMPAVDRAIARLATWEIVYNDDVDIPVSVNEAMTLARMLSTEESPRFLNGLLARIGDLADTLR